VIEEVDAFVGREAIEGKRGGLKQALEGALSVLSEDCLEFGEGHFDGVEIRTISRKVKKFSAPCLNGLSDTCHLVRREVVTDYHVPLLEFRRENLLYILHEGVPIHGAIQKHGCGDTIMTQGCNEGGTLPMAMRDGSPAALSTGRTPIQTAHLCIESRFIQKDQAPYIPVDLSVLPPRPSFLNIRSLLLCGV
jgi:hypothetical protein